MSNKRRITHISNVDENLVISNRTTAELSSYIMRATASVVGDSTASISRPSKSMLEEGQIDTSGQYSIVLDVLDRIGCGAIIVNEKGSIVATNKAVLDLLGLETSDECAGLATLSNELVTRMCAMEVRLRDSDRNWVTWQREPGHDLTVMRLSTQLPDTSSVIVFIDLAYPMRPAHSTLRCLFGLTAAEIKIAEEIAAGRTLAEAAQILHRRLPTVRSQLGSIFNKTETRRQSELVQLLARVSILR